MTQYLVEFSVEGDCKKSLYIDILSGKEVETEEIDLLEESGKKWSNKGDISRCS